MESEGDGSVDFSSDDEREVRDEYHHSKLPLQDVKQYLNALG